MNLHSIDFSNEYGYQVEINKTFDNSANMLFAYAYALHHRQYDDDQTIMLDDKFPYKQYYIETSKWSKTGKFYYIVGYDFYREKSISKNYFIAKSRIVRSAPYTS